MSRFLSSRWRCAIAVAAAMWLLPAGLPAAEKASRAKPEPQVVPMFAGIESGQLEVQLIPRNAERGQLLITNKTDQPLAVQVPEAFAGVPVLAQMFPPGPPGLPPNNAPQQIGNAPQQFPPFGPMAGPMNLPGGGANNPLFGPGGGPMWNLAPEQVGKIKVTSVCLEYGKPNPRPKIKYEVKPLEEVSQEPGLAEVITELGRGRIPQRVAQLAAWHLNNAMSWKELAGLKQKYALGTPHRYSRKEIEAAKDLVEKAVEAAKKRPSSSLGSTASR